MQAATKNLVEKENREALKIAREKDVRFVQDALYTLQMGITKCYHAYSIVNEKKRLKLQTLLCPDNCKPFYDSNVVVNEVK